MPTMFAIPFEQGLGLRRGHRPGQQLLQAPLDLGHASLKTAWAQFSAPLAQMDRFLKQRLHLARPGQARTAFYQPLQIADLVRQAQLETLGWRAQLRCPTIAHPGADPRRTHDFWNDLPPATGA